MKISVNGKCNYKLTYTCERNQISNKIQMVESEVRFPNNFVLPSVKSEKDKDRGFKTPIIIVYSLYKKNRICLVKGQNIDYVLNSENILPEVNEFLEVGMGDNLLKEYIEKYHIQEKYIKCLDEIKIIKPNNKKNKKYKQKISTPELDFCESKTVGQKSKNKKQEVPDVNIDRSKPKKYQKNKNF